MMDTQTIHREQNTSAIFRVSSAAFIISVIGVAIQGLAGLLIYGVASIATAFFSSIPAGVISDWSINGGPFTAAAAWPILAGLIAFTVGVFAVGLFGTIWLRSTDATKIRVGAALVIVSALVSVTTGWGLILGSVLMFTGSIIGFATIQRVNNSGNTIPA